MATINKEARKFWLEGRRKFLGGSDMAKILGISKWGSGVDVKLDKKGLLPEQPETEAMWLGNVMEPIIADRFSEETGLKCIEYKPNIVVDEMMGGDLDRIVVEADQNPYEVLERLRQGDLTCVKAILECKTAAKTDDWIDEDGNETIPEYYRSQVMWYMGLIPSCERCYVSVYFTGLNKGFRTIVVERDDSLIKKLQKFAKNWWKKYIIDDEEPEVTTATEVSLLYPKSVPQKSIEASEEIAEKIAEYKKQSEIESAAKKAKESAKDDIVSFMKDNEGLMNPEGTVLLATYKSAKDTISDVTDWQAVAKEAGATAELIEKHTKKGVVTRKGSRSLKLKAA